MFFGSEIVATILDPVLRAIPEVTAAVDDRIIASTLIPQDMPLPALSFAAMEGSYTGAIGRKPKGQINFEQVTIVVRLICNGDSTDPIYAAAVAQLERLDGQGFDYAAPDGHNYRATFTAAGEVLPTTLAEAKTSYRQLGTIYTVELTRS